MSNKILILEDEQAIRQSYVFYFEDRKWDPLEAESAEKALDIIEKEKPNFAIVDIKLTGMDGYSFIKSAYELSPSMVFVVCTGTPQFRIHDELSYITGLSTQCFSKPIDDMGLIEQELLKTMKKAVKK